MALYYQLVFVILTVETVVFTLLALPLPTTVRRGLTRMLSRPFMSPTLQTAIKVVLGFIMLLFLDTLNRMYIINKEYEQAKGMMGYAHDRIEILSRKFLAQRNMYLTGITLFLTFVIVRTFNIALELFAMKDRSAAVKSTRDESERELRELIKKKDEEISLLKEQAAALAKDM
ncbi:HCL216Wp [Eremothecium sinecaudum]|uniref:Endoplasmic reticulum transmembrane protein n=1 Tax=Eremothecium sinecaudum TaxID=45286 RepID=A0A120K1Z4_9SACH|nr:HCL216Wp [Eremothecium sinecaudum]AMD19935.1 HCL216Wp [Eremothecium sinecaudum]